jgi:L-asparaginase / beta-aspartyl-peptidase
VQSRLSFPRMTSTLTRITSSGGRRRAPTRRKPPSSVLGVHGGAGVIERSAMSADAEREYRAAITTALMAGHRILAAGGSSLDAVAAAVTVFEDDPLFNAGRGAAFTADGTNELDAAIMDGATLNAGAVTLVTTVKNPVLLARLVMEKTQHVMLAGHGAEALARKYGLEIVSPSYFFSQRRFNALQRMKQAEIGSPSSAFTDADKHGTVGAVALDAAGNLAAATSTGGRNNKLSGRVGDTPIIGAGTYANNATVAVSGTGEGEYFMRALAAHSVSALIEHRGWSVKRAAEHVVHRQLARLGGSGGLIALDRHGRIAMPFNTCGMYRGYICGHGEPVVKIYGDE